MLWLSIKGNTGFSPNCNVGRESVVDSSRQSRHGWHFMRMKQRSWIQMDPKLLAKAKHVLAFRKTIRMEKFCELMGGIIWQHATEYLYALDWFKFNKYQWAHPSMKGLV